MMYLSKIIGLLFSTFAFTLCNTPEKNAISPADSLANLVNAPTDTSVNANRSAVSSQYGVWSGGELTTTQLAQYPFVKGWYVAYRWEKLEPQKDHFDWAYFDDQMKTAFDNNLNIGFMIWVGQHCPIWLYTNGVPQVNTTSKKKLSRFPFYLNPLYKERYFNMLKAVATHIQTMPPAYKNKIIMWMSAEGSTGDVTPYKGKPNNDVYNITEDQWLGFKKETWLYMQKLCQSAAPHLNLLVNQGNDGRYFNWLVENIPNVWMKAGNISHTYQFNGELEYYSRLQKLNAKTAADSASSRLRGEITVQGTYFNQHESWNMYALLTSCLHFGLDIFNAAPKYIMNPTDSSTFNFFNFYAGQKVAATSPGAFCIFKDGLDAADTKRFPESFYGPILDPAKIDNYNKQIQRKGKGDDEEGADQNIDLSNAKDENLSQIRVDKILAEFAPYGAQRGQYQSLADSAIDAAQAINDKSLNPARKKGNEKNGKLRKNPERQKIKEERIKSSEPDAEKMQRPTEYQLKREASMIVNDIGVNIIADNYYRFLVQYSPNTTSRGYWRVGPGDQPYGRFARGFNAKEGMTEMYFALDKKFFNGSTTAQKVTVKIIYLDKGNGNWSLNYYGPKGRKEAYKISCTNSGNWITKTVLLTDAMFIKKLDHSCDVSIKYLGGDNTIFNSIEILR